MRNQNRIVLSDNQLTALRHRLAGLSYQNIAGVMECSESSAWQFVRRAMRNIERARKMEARLVEYL